MAPGWIRRLLGRGIEDTLTSIPHIDESSPKEKRYLGILESYGVSWPLEKAARDTLQNFFDSNGATLDGVAIDVHRDGLAHVVAIQNHATYDYRELLHLGGTTKNGNDETAGGIGEGAKILAFVLLRDYAFSAVRFGSQDWSVEFSLEHLPEGEYVSRRKGLFATVSKTSLTEGNYVLLRTNASSHAKAFLDAKDLFFHPANPDFAEPTLLVKGVGGFTFLGRGRAGNFYVAGQRRHMDAERWGTLENVSVWVDHNNVLRRDRDRGLVTRKELITLVLPSLIKSAGRADLIRAVYALEPIWSETSGYENKIGPTILEKAASALNGDCLAFPEKYLARTHFFDYAIEQRIEAQGHVLCNPCLGKIGMKTTAERYREMSVHLRRTPNEREDRRLAVLYEAARLLTRTPKDAWLFNAGDEKSILRGEHKESFVWLSTDVLQDPFFSALSVYLHELDHDHGGDRSPEFGYALTKTIASLGESVFSRREQYAPLVDRWNKA